MSNYFLLVFFPNIGCFFGVLSAIGISFSAIMVPICHLSYEHAIDEQAKERYFKMLKILSIIFSLSIFFLFLSCFFPSKQEAMHLSFIY